MFHVKSHFTLNLQEIKSHKSNLVVFQIWGLYLKK